MNTAMSHKYTTPSRSIKPSSPIGARGLSNYNNPTTRMVAYSRNNMNQATALSSLSTPDAATLPRVVIKGTRIYIGNVLPVSPQGKLVGERDIEQQTHAAFQ